jgi:hypothetical protein
VVRDQELRAEERLCDKSPLANATGCFLHKEKRTFSLKKKFTATRQQKVELGSREQTE